MSERILIEKAQRAARSEVKPSPATLAAYDDLDSCDTLEQFEALKHSGRGPLPFGWHSRMRRAGS